MEFHKPKNNECSMTFNLKQNTNPNEGVATTNRVSRVMQDPLDAPLMASITIHNPETKRRCRGTLANFECPLVSTIPND
jgi:hypothetical protein